MTETKTMPMKDAAAKILEEAGGPLKSDEITRVAQEQKLLKSKGKTPAATMAAQLSTDVGKADSRFVRTRPGTYGLKGRDRKGAKAVEA